MQVYDIIMLVVLLGATLFGAWKGLAWQLASLGAVVVSYFVALEFRETVAGYIQTEAPWNVFLAMLILYVATSLVIWILFRLVSGFIDRLKLKEFDRQIGALLGLAKGVLLCILITLFAVALLGEVHRETIISSRSGRYIARLLDEAHTVMPPEIHDVLHPYMHPFSGSNGETPGGSAHHHGLHDHGAGHDHDDESSGSSDSPQYDLIPVNKLLKSIQNGSPMPSE